MPQEEQFTHCRGKRVSPFRRGSEKSAKTVKIRQGACRQCQQKLQKTGTKNRQKNQQKSFCEGQVMPSESYSVSEAARILGVSIPTVKRMAADGQVEGFKTSGGHLRIVAESIKALRGQRPQPRPAHEPSPVLTNRRERVEELALEAQELRAKREIARLQAEQEAEVRRQEQETDAQEIQAEREAEAARLRRERLRSQEARERERREAERQLAAFRSRWLGKVTKILAAQDLRWLSAGQRKEILDAAEAEIDTRQICDEPHMMEIVTHTIAAVVEPYAAERQTWEQRNQVVEGTLRRLPFFATEAERARVAAAVRESLDHLRADAKEFEIRAAADETIRPLRRAIEKRLLDERLITWAIRELPLGSDDRDEARLRRDCVVVLADLPEDASEVEVQEALEPTIREACKEVEKRQAQKRRGALKASLIQYGIAEVSNYLRRLNQAGEISSRDYWDSDLRADLARAARQEMEAELTGEETTKEVAELVDEIVDEALD
jgi:excisionase family DNA binding protein